MDLLFELGWVPKLRIREEQQFLLIVVYSEGNPL